MNRLLVTLRKDLKTSLRSFYFYIELIMAVIIVAILLFVVPENFTTTQTVHMHVDADLPIDVSSLAGLSLQDEEAVTQIVLEESSQAVRAALAENREALGILISGQPPRLELEFVLQGYESDAIRNLIEKSVIASQLQQRPDAVDRITVTTLEEPTESLPDRVHILPILLVLNSAMIGLFVIASYVFMDKEDGTIRAFAVTPAHLWQYLLAKVIVMLMTGLATGFFTAYSVAGFQTSGLALAAILIASNLLGSVLGLFIASFFDTLTKSLGALYIVIMIMGFSAVPYMMPGFSPLYLRMLPAYPMFFAFREALLEQPDYRYVLTWCAVFIAASGALFLWSVVRFRKTLTV